MTRRTRRAWLGDDGRAPTPLYLPVSFLVLGLVVSGAIVILAIGARSPYTHGNLAPGYDPGYTRTQQVLVGDDTTYPGISPVSDGSTSAVERGEQLFVGRGCVACHALEGRGGVVGPPIAGSSVATILKRVRTGPAGMPHYSAETLSDAEVSDIAAYLRSLTPVGTK